MLLEKIGSPADLKKIPLEQLPKLSCEIRERMVNVVSCSGGHLASSLGAVELTVALHYSLDTPRDKIVWDVGHQSYAHKILTGRNECFDSLREFSGLTGFPCKDESEHDPFTTGHSSTAVSLCLGLVAARDLLPKEDYFKVVAVIGDGSLSGGLCFEGLNNAGHLKKDIMVVLNTNEMSIAPNVGAISNYLNKLISMPVYNRFKTSLEAFLQSRGPRGSRILKMAYKFEEGIKGLFVPGMLFEELGFRYFGPFDGHNMPLLIQNLKKLSTIKGPVLVHVVTKKGKGYTPAECDPVKFHSAPPFEIATGKSKPKPEGTRKSYTEVFSQKLAAMGKADKKIVAITAAMPEGTGLDRFRDDFPDRFFDVGIAEGHAVCFAAGLARKGFKPVVAVYSTFLQRAYDQIVEAVALQSLNVTFAIDRAGIVGGDGATHQGIFDIAYLRGIPGIVVMAPKDAQELEGMLEFAADLRSPAAIRYPKEEIPAEKLPCPALELGKAQIIKQGVGSWIIAYGTMVMPSLAAARALEKQGVDIGVINARFAKPLDEELFKKISSGSRHIFTVEEGILQGGFGSAVGECIEKPVIRIGLPSEFIPCGKRELLLDKYGLTAGAIADKVRECLK